MTKFYKDDSDLLDILEARNDDEIEKRAALIKLLDISQENLNALTEHDGVFYYQEKLWLVGTNSEMDNIWKDRLLLEVYNDLPFKFTRYFDFERWIDDKMKYACDRKQALSYDNKEFKTEIDGITYYVY